MATAGSIISRPACEWMTTNYDGVADTPVGQLASCSLFRGASHALLTTINRTKKRLMRRGVTLCGNEQEEEEREE